MFRHKKGATVVALAFMGTMTIVGDVPRRGAWHPPLVQAADKTDKTVQHVVGTVAAIDQKRLVVTTFKGQTISIKLTKQVRYKDKTNPQSNLPPAVGDRVIVEAVRNNKILTAKVIHYSPMNQPPLQPE